MATLADVDGPTALPPAEAAEASLRTWRVAGHNPAVRRVADLLPRKTDLGPVGALEGVVISDIRRIELFADSATRLADLSSSTESLTADGWEVWMLVPTSKLGEARQACRHSHIQRLQGYWSADGASFGAPQLL